MTQSEAISVEDTGSYVPLYTSSTQVASELAIEYQEEQDESGSDEADVPANTPEQDIK